MPLGRSIFIVLSLTDQTAKSVGRRSSLLDHCVFSAWRYEDRSEVSETRHFYALLGTRACNESIVCKQFNARAYMPGDLSRRTEM